MRSFPASEDDLFTAPEVARFCRVDLKTIHNWVDRDQIKHFRTPGRHLRFRRKDVYDFLKRFDYPVPQELQFSQPLVFVLTRDGASGANLRRQLAPATTVEVFEDVLDLLMRVGEQPPEALVVDSDALDMELARLRRTLDRTELSRTCRIVMLFDEARPVSPSERVHAHAWIPRSSVRELKAALDAVLGS